MRPELIERTRATLGDAGYQLTGPGPVRPVSFDLAARRGGVLLLVKVFTNADSLSEPLAQELRVLAGLLRGAPLLVGERSSAGPLEDGVLYLRHRVPLVTLPTLEAFLGEGEPPLVYAAPGGYYVNLDGPLLRALRQARSLSLGQVAEVAGVSRRAVAMYEEGMGALVEVAERLEDFFGEALVRPMAVFQPPAVEEPRAFDPARVREALERDLLGRLSALGYRVITTERSLFNAVGQEERREQNLILTSVGELQPESVDRARALQRIGAVVEREVVLIVRDRRTREHVEGAPLLDQRDLARADGCEAILELIRRRAGPAEPPAGG